MQIDWQALGTVLGVTLAVTVGLVGVFTLGIVGLARREAAADGAAVSGVSGALTRTGAYACFALCAAAVAYGIYLIVA
jgi:hypothetical protein